MKEWWNTLALREKQMVSLGVTILGAFLIYLILWLPLSNYVSSLREQIQNNQELLTWMKGTDKQIQALEKGTNRKLSKSSAGSLLNIVQKHIKTSSISTSVTQLHQSENDSVQLTFKNVSFDKLIAWIIPFTQQQECSITQMTVTPTASIGMVSAELVLTLPKHKIRS